MWKEKLQDTAASHPWLEPHEAIKRKTQAPGMQLVDWYGFTVPKTKKEMFLKQSARREDLLVVGEVDNIHSFFSDYETEWRSNILFDDLDEALRYCEDVRSGFISDIQLHSSFIMYKEPGFKAMPGGGFAGWSDLFYAAHGNLEYANKLLFDCQAGDRDGMDPRRCAREDLINGVIAEFGSEYIMTGDAGQKNRLNSAEILRFELDSVPTDGNGHITGYFHGFPLGTSLEDISAAIDNVGKVENGHPNRIDVPEEPERIEPEQNVGVSNEKPTVTEIEDSSIREPKSHPTQSGKPVWTNLEVPPDNVRLLTGVSRKTDRPWYRADCNNALLKASTRIRLISKRELEDVAKITLDGELVEWRQGGELVNGVKFFSQELLYFSNGRSASITERACKISQFIKNANPELPDEIIAGWMGLPPTVLETMKRDQLRNDQVSEQDD